MTHEQPIVTGKIETYPPETAKIIDVLLANNYVIHPTTGRSLYDLQKEGLRFSFVSPSLEHSISEPALLAFKPDPKEIFISKEEHINILDKIMPFQADQQVREATVSEWAELAWRHFRSAGVRLFDRTYGELSTWTSTYEEGLNPRRALVGGWYEPAEEVGGLSVTLQPVNLRTPYISTAHVIQILSR